MMNKSSLNIRTDYPAIRINFGKEISINKRVLFTLGNPENIHFGWNKRNLVLLIGDAGGETPMSVKIDDCYYNTKNSKRIVNRKIIQTIMSVTGLRNDVIYIMKGDYVSEINMVAFNLADLSCLSLP